MRDADCTAFLQEALPRLGLRWAGFRRVRRQVCRRLDRRLRALGLESLDAYRAWLARHPEEWEVLDGLCRVTISRFWRDRAVFDALGARLLPELAALARARGDAELRAWSAGCASGEEAWSLALLWQLELGDRPPQPSLRVIGTDLDTHLLERAATAVYPASSLREIPAGLRARAFERCGDAYRLRSALRMGVEFRPGDVRRQAPADRGPFHLVLCRNLAFTYFDAAVQREVLERIADTLVPDGALLVGSHERLPSDAHRFVPDPSVRGAYRLRDGEATRPRRSGRRAAAAGRVDPRGRS
jgi:chemotaxis protein methyltransferase CheR